MPDPTTFDLDFRPADYFDEPEAAAPPAAPAGPNLPPPPHTHFKDMDPWALLTMCLAPDPATGGGFLPPLRGNEVEIARVRLESSTFDVISVRARVCARRIYYSVVDEYEGQVVYDCSRRSSLRPLTMRRLIDLMETTTVDDRYTGLVLGMMQDGFECSGYAGQWVHFATVTSDIYPQLGAWYDNAMEEWYRSVGGTVGR